ncbi:unnamed protein product [Adineta ricciae]|nr:unnamed protein product [Adineta ricciae]
MAQNITQELKEQGMPLTGTTDTPMSDNTSSSSAKKCCANTYGYCLYFLLGFFLLNICIALILGGGRFGLLPVISRTGSFICLSLAGLALVGLLVATIHWKIIQS